MAARNKKYILWFNEICIRDVPLVGGKNASLGEMYRKLTGKGVNVPNGFAITAAAYQHIILSSNIGAQLEKTLKGVDTGNIEDLMNRGKKTRELILNAEIPEDLKKEITTAYKKLSSQYGKNTDVAVRSSATAEDLPDASFAGQQETYLNIRGEYQLIEACKKCFASLFTNRAISYRVDKGFDHFKVYLSIGVQKMVRSDLASSGVLFSIDTESGFEDVVFITGAWGLGENVVQGAVNPDEYYVHKPTLKKGFKSIIAKNVGSKKLKMVYAQDGSKHPTKNVQVSEVDRKRFVLSDTEVLTLAKWAVRIEDHYKKPMDIEWAKDGRSGKLFIVQARPETVHSQEKKNVLRQYRLKRKTRILVTGDAVGEMIGQGPANVIKDVHDIERFKKGQVLVTEMTDPDWEPIMKIASAIVTNRGGRTCFAGDTKILTNRGFASIKELHENFKLNDPIYVPSMNRETLKIEWKKVLASMKREAKVMEVSISQTGKTKKNSLHLTPDHKMPTFKDRKLVSKEVSELLAEENMALVAQCLPPLDESCERDRKLAYLLGALSTDGHIYLTRTHGEVTFIQKQTEEKKKFISTVNECLKDVCGKSFRVSEKKQSTGLIRGKPVIGNATAFRCYSKQIATELIAEQQELVKTLLSSDTDLSYCFLAGVIDGDGSYNDAANRINIYCSSDDLLEAVTVACLRLCVVPQVTTNRNIYNVQIVEKVDEILAHTKRVKGKAERKTQGVRFFAAKQLLKDVVDEVNWDGKIKPYVLKNLLLDSEKISSRILRLSSEEVKGELEWILNSDTRMQRVTLVQEPCGTQDVFNLTVEDNHNYVVFTERYTPVVVENCHAAIVSRELGIPCVIGSETGTQVLKSGQKVTVSCAEGEKGHVFDGILPFEVKTTNIAKLPATKTKIMMNVGIPENAFEQANIPNDGVGLAREEFIINSYIQIHPMALLDYAKIKKNPENREIVDKIDELTYGYSNKTQFFIDRLAQGIARIGAAFYPKDVIVRLSDFKSNEYANLIGGKLYEPVESNPMIGWRGASRYYDENYRRAFALECKAFLKVRDEMGLTNVKVMVPFCRTPAEGRKVIAEMKKNKLVKGKNGLEVYVMCEIPSNVICADEFSQIFDGFSIGTNDLTQLTLGLDRDSELVAHIYDERETAVKRMVASVIASAHKYKRKIGICGQAPSDFPEFAEFLVECGIDSMSLNPDTVLKTRILVAKKEKALKRKR